MKAVLRADDACLHGTFATQDQMKKAVKLKQMNIAVCNSEQILSCTCPAPLRETQDSAGQ
jgi:hypothetical protein